MESKTHIDVRNLTVWYGQHRALKSITLNIPDKRITAIIGPSGCGKTTLLKSFNRLIDLQDGVKLHGRILVDGVDIYDPKVDVMHVRKKMGLLSQKPQVLPMSIYENVAYGPRIHGQRDKKKLREIVERRLRETGLWDEVRDRLHGPASKLSIGQQQRLCLARGLAVEPEVILGDEPTSALDPVSAERIEQRLLELKDEYTIVVVTHSLRQAKRLADYVVFLYLGTLVEQGPAERIFKTPRYLRTQNYINGTFDEEPKVDAELSLKGVGYPDGLDKTRLALEKLRVGQVLKIIVNDETAAAELPLALESEGHRLLGIESLSITDWEVVVQKWDDAFSI